MHTPVTILPKISHHPFPKHPLFHTMILASFAWCWFSGTHEHSQTTRIPTQPYPLTSSAYGNARLSTCSLSTRSAKIVFGGPVRNGLYSIVSWTYDPFFLGDEGPNIPQLTWKSSSPWGGFLNNYRHQRFLKQPVRIVPDTGISVLQCVCKKGALCWNKSNAGWNRPIFQVTKKKLPWRAP